MWIIKKTSYSSISYKIEKRALDFTANLEEVTFDKQAIQQARQDLGLADESFVSIATSFSGGMSSRCLCGAVAGSQMVIGSMYGKNAERDGKKARALAKEFNETFAQKYKVNCCKVLSAGFDFHSPERKQHCSGMVSDCAVILEDIIKANQNINV